MTFKDMKKELTETIELESDDIEKLESIIEAKRQRITDCMRVLIALEKGGFLDE